MPAQNARQLRVGLHLNLQWESIRNFNDMNNTNVLKMKKVGTFLLKIVGVNNILHPYQFFYLT